MTNMREWITLVEAAGTYSFFRPRDKREIMCDRTYETEHADYILDHPEQFGISQAEIAEARTHDDASRMSLMARLLALAFAKGWVRVNYYRGSWSFQALDQKTARRALAHYFNEDFIQEANLDWGPEPAHPIESISLYPEGAVKRYVKTGRVGPS